MLGSIAHQPLQYHCFEIMSPDSLATNSPVQSSWSSLLSLKYVVLLIAYFVFIASTIPFPRAFGALGALGAPGALAADAAAWVDAVAPGGVTCGSAYLWTSEGPTPRNVAILVAFAVEAEAMGLPWVLGGDFKFTPEALQESPGSHSTCSAEQTSGSCCDFEELPVICWSPGDQREISPARQRQLDFFWRAAKL